MMTLDNACSFTFREDMGVQVMFGSTTYGAGNNVLTVELSQYQAIVVQDRGQADLTGKQVGEEEGRILR